MKKDLSGDAQLPEEGVRELRADLTYQRHADDISEEELAEFGLGRD